MKKLILIGLSLASFNAMAGVMNGGGGKGVVCRDSQNKVISVELLDLWEARILYGNEPAPLASNDLAAEVGRAIERLKNSYPMRTHSESFQCDDQDCIPKFLGRNAKPFLTDDSSLLRLRGVKLEDTNDSFELTRPADCAVEQIVTYPLQGKILINQDLFEKMNLLNQVALVVHESFYRFLRDFAHETNSVRARRSVGYVMAGHSFEAKFREIPREHVVCWNPGVPYSPTQLVVSRNAETGKVHLQHVMFRGSDFIGIGKQQMVLPNDRYFFEQLRDGKCESTDFMIMINSVFSGPVEFDRLAQVQFSCQSGKMAVHYTDRSPGVSEAVTVPLECKFRSGTSK